MNQELARSQFIEAVGAALDLATREGVPPLDMIVCLGGYVDIVVRCAGGNNLESAQMFSALSEKYACENTIPPIGHPFYAPCYEATSRKRIKDG